jgi:hypothetical protein
LGFARLQDNTAPAVVLAREFVGPSYRDPAAAVVYEPTGIPGKIDATFGRGWFARYGSEGGGNAQGENAETHGTVHHLFPRSLAQNFSESSFCEGGMIRLLQTYIVPQMGDVALAKRAPQRNKRPPAVKLTGCLSR